MVARGRCARARLGHSRCRVQLQRWLVKADEGGRRAFAGLLGPSVRLQGIVGRCGCRCHSLCACCRCAHAGVFGATRGRPGCRRHCVCCRSHTRVLGAAASSQAGWRSTPPRKDDPSVGGLHTGHPQWRSTQGPPDLSIVPCLLRFRWGSVSGRTPTKLARVATAASHGGRADSGVPRRGGLPKAHPGSRTSAWCAPRSTRPS